MTGFGKEEEEEEEDGVAAAACLPHRKCSEHLVESRLMDKSLQAGLCHGWWDGWRGPGKAVSVEHWPAKR